MIDLTCHMDASELMAAMARLKKIPMTKVVRNSARDFARAAKRATPVAVKSKSEYYTFVQGGRRRYLHESMFAGRSKKSMQRLRKVRIAKNWSQASWFGIFRVLGLPAPKIGRLPADKIALLSNAVDYGDDTNATMHMTDYIQFNRFGRGTDHHSAEIARAGFRAAAKIMKREVNRMLKKEWRGRR